MSWPTDKELPLDFIQYLLGREDHYYSYDEIKALYVEWVEMEKP